jgi:hypothetical protein
LKFILSLKKYNTKKTCEIEEKNISSSTTSSPPVIIRDNKQKRGPTESMILEQEQPNKMVNSINYLNFKLSESLKNKAKENTNENKNLNIQNKQKEIKN